jgi:rubrerythrin
MSSLQHFHHFATGNHPPEFYNITTMIEGEDLLLCPTCGTQFDTPASDPPSGYCRICDVND